MFHTFPIGNPLSGTWMHHKAVTEEVKVALLVLVPEPSHLPVQQNYRNFLTRDLLSHR
jgi:hypothetical protein